MAVNVNVIGRLGRDSELINGPRGQFLSFSLATDEFKNGNKGTAWLRVTSNNTKMLEWLKKGRMVNVIGTETVNSYQDRNGQTQINRDISADKIEFVNNGSGQTQNDSSNAQNTSNQTIAAAPITTGNLTPPQNVMANANGAVADDDLPF